MQNQEISNDLLIDNEIEYHVIAFCILNGKEFYNIASELEPTDFYNEHLGGVFSIMKDRFKVGLNIDSAIIMSELKAKGRSALEANTLIMNILEGHGDIGAYKLEDYAKIIKNLSKKRQLKSIIESLPERIKEGENADTLCEETTTELMKIVTSSNNNIYDASRCVDELDEHLKNVENATGSGLLGITTGYKVLDAVTGGLLPGEVLTIAARPSIGKSSAAVSMAVHAIEKGKRVVFITLEMSTLDLLKKIISIKSRVSYTKLANGNKLSTETFNNEKEKVDLAKDWLRKTNLYIVDETNLTIGRLRSILKKIESQCGEIDIIFLDYLQLMVEPTLMKFGNTTVTTYLSQQIKICARFFKCPIVSLCQFNRGPEMERPQKPKLYHLRESGSIEQDSDMVIGLYRESRDPSIADKQKPENCVEFLFLKHRQGILKDFDAMFDNLTSGIVDPVQDKTEEQQQKQHSIFDAKASIDEDFLSDL